MRLAVGGGKEDVLALKSHLQVVERVKAERETELLATRTKLAEFEGGEQSRGPALRLQWHAERAVGVDF